MDLFRRLGRAVGLLACLTLVCLSAPVHARPPLKSDSKVKIAFEAGKIDTQGNQVFVLYLTIEKGWHIYANPVGNKELENAETHVSVKAAHPLQILAMEYPPGKLVKDKNGDYYSFEDNVIIKAQVRRTVGDFEALEVGIKLQACNETLKQCLLPGTAKLYVK